MSSLGLRAWRLELGILRLLALGFEISSGAVVWSAAPGTHLEDTTDDC